MFFSFSRGRKHRLSWCRKNYGLRSPLVLVSEAGQAHGYAYEKASGAEQCMQMPGGY